MIDHLMMNSLVDIIGQRKVGKNLKGFTDDSGKFRPFTQYKKGVRMSRDQKEKQQGVKVEREKRDSIKESDVVIIPNHGQMMDAFARLKEKSKWGERKSSREEGGREANINESNSFSEGFDRGLAIAESTFDEAYNRNVRIGTDISKLDFGATEFELGFTKIKNRDDLEEFIRQSAFMAEENDRSFSPFEFTAKELHERSFDDEGNPISDAFDAFEDGIGEAINWYTSFIFEHNEDFGR